MRVVFFGTPDVAARCLRVLHAAGVDIVLVVTQPDRPKGRGLRVTETPTKLAADELGIPVLQPASANASESLERLSALEPDLFVVVSFGQIFRAPLLALPRLGCVNLHFSLLPRHRGAAPVQHALLSGEAVTGVTTMFMDAGLDTGDIILQAEEPILADDTTESLMERLADRGAALLIETVSAIATGTAPRRPQPGEGVTTAPSIRREQGHVRWSLPARELCCLRRALGAWPGCVCWLRGERVRIWDAQPLEADPQVQAEPGTVLAVMREGLRVRCGDGDLLLTRLQPAGGRAMDARAFANGYRVDVGDRFDGEPDAGTGGDPA